MRHLSTFLPLSASVIDPVVFRDSTLSTYLPHLKRRRHARSTTVSPTGLRAVRRQRRFQLIACMPVNKCFKCFKTVAGTNLSCTGYFIVFHPGYCKAYIPYKNASACCLSTLDHLLTENPCASTSDSSVIDLPRVSNNMSHIQRSEISLTDLIRDFRLY